MKKILSKTLLVHKYSRLYDVNAMNINKNKKNGVSIYMHTIAICIIGSIGYVKHKTVLYLAKELDM